MSASKIGTNKITLVRLREAVKAVNLLPGEVRTTGLPETGEVRAVLAAAKELKWPEKNLVLKADFVSSVTTIASGACDDMNKLWMWLHGPQEEFFLVKAQIKAQARKPL